MLTFPASGTSLKIIDACEADRRRHPFGPGGSWPVRRRTPPPPFACACVRPREASKLARAPLPWGVASHTHQRSVPVLTQRRQKFISLGIGPRVQPCVSGNGFGSWESIFSATGRQVRSGRTSCRRAVLSTSSWAQRDPARRSPRCSRGRSWRPATCRSARMAGCASRSPASARPIAISRARRSPHGTRPFRRTILGQSTIPEARTGRCAIACSGRPCAVRKRSRSTCSSRPARSATSRSNSSSRATRSRSAG